MTFIADSRKPDHVENVYIPMREDGVFIPELAVRTFKAPNNEMEFKYRLEWELLDLVKKEKVTPSQFQELISKILLQESPLKYGSIDILIDALIHNEDLLTKIKQLKFPADRRSNYKEKLQAKKYLEEERNLAGLLELIF